MDDDLDEFIKGCEDAEKGIAHDDSKGEAYSMGYAHQSGLNESANDE